MKTEIKTELDACTNNDGRHTHKTEIKLEPTTHINDEDKHKQMLADAVHHAVNQLKEEGMITSTVSEMISTESEELGREICRLIKDLAHNQSFKFVEVKKEPVTENDVEVVFATQPSFYDMEERPGSAFVSQSSFASEEAIGHDNIIPWDMKVKAVTLATLYPRWGLEAIRQKTTPHLRTHEQLSMWKQAVRKDTVSENYSIISELTYRRFLDVNSKSQPVTVRMLQDWGIEASQQFLSTAFKFKASSSWIFKLLKKYNLWECKATGFLEMI